MLRPGWLALLLTVIVFAGACFWLLSPWQFRRNAEREAQNAQITSAETTPAEPLNTVLPHDSAVTAATRWRQITVTGQYQSRLETVARLRQVDDQPAYEILTPLRADDGTLVLIDRGYVLQQNGGLPSYPAPPNGTVTVTARAQPDETDPDNRQPLRQDGHLQVYAIGTPIVDAARHVDLRPGYFTLVDHSPGVLGVLPLPDLDSGPFFSYALQWIAFGVMAIGGLGYFTARELRPGGALTADGRARRRQEKANRELASGQAERERTNSVRGRRAVAAAVAAEEEQESTAASKR